MRTISKCQRVPIPDRASQVQTVRPNSRPCVPRQCFQDCGQDCGGPRRRLHDCAAPRRRFQECVAFRAAGRVGCGVVRVAHVLVRNPRLSVGMVLILSCCPLCLAIHDVTLLSSFVLLVPRSSLPSGVRDLCNFMSVDNFAKVFSVRWVGMWARGQPE